MANSYISEGGRIDWTNGTGSAVSSGDVVQVGFKQLGVALVDIASTAVGAVETCGVFELKKASGAIVQGAPVWWDAVAENVINAPTLTAWFLGYAVEAESSPATTVKVKLEEFANETPRILTLAATGTQAVGAGAFMAGELTLLGTATGAHTVTLPALAAVPVGSKLTVRKISGGGFAITLDGNSSETIGGGATFASIDADNDMASFQASAAPTWQLIWSIIA
jgi:predicted RecA/RadA family phage recombinase